MSSILLDSTPPDIEVTSVSVATLVATPPAIEEFHNEHREQQTTEQPSSVRRVLRLMSTLQHKMINSVR